MHPFLKLLAKLVGKDHVVLHDEDALALLRARLAHHGQVALETSIRPDGIRPARRHPRSASIHRRKPFHGSHTGRSKARLHPIPSLGPSLQIYADAIWKKLTERRAPIVHF